MTTVARASLIPAGEAKSAVAQTSRIGGSKVKFAPATTAKIRFKLTKRARTALKRAKRLKAIVKVVARHGTQTTSKTIKAPAQRR